MSADLDLSAVALVISLIALVIAIGQILQQYAATAEGFRNCRQDVIADWANLTRSPFDLRNLRYETRYVSPHISFAAPKIFYESPTNDHERFDKVLPIGHKDLPRGLVQTNGLPSARVSWLALLEHLRSYQLGLYHNAFDPVTEPASDESNAEKGHSQKLGLDEWFDKLSASKNGALSMPVASKTIVSWDFMPPDATKPFATIPLHDLLVLGHRLCLDWTEVNPQAGRLTAQDDYGNDLSAHRVNGLGLMVHFQHDAGRSKLRSKGADVTSVSDFKIDYLYVPSAEADRLAFGIIPGDTELELQDVHVAEQDDCVQYIRNLAQDTDQKQSNAADLLQRSFQQSQLRRSGFDQLMPLISPCLLLPGCKTTMVRRPNAWSHVGILEVMEGYVVFRERIDQMKAAQGTSGACKETIAWIRKEWQDLADHFMPFVWAAFRTHKDKVRLSTETSRVHHQCTERLKTWTTTVKDKVAQWARNREEPEILAKRRPMDAMLSFHMLRAVALRERAEKLNLKEVNTYEMPFPEAPIFCAMMHMMIDDLDDLCKEVIRYLVGRERYATIVKEDPGFHEELIDETRQAWLIWIFRALVFNRSASFEEPRRSGSGGRPYKLISANWLYSQIPVHIS